MQRSHSTSTDSTIQSACTYHSDTCLLTSMRAECNMSIKTHLRGPSRRDHFNESGGSPVPGSGAANTLTQLKC